MLALAFVLSLAANDVDVAVRSDKLPGEKPALVLKVNKDLKSATLDVKSAAGHAHQTLGPKDSGGELSYLLPQTTPGTVSWQGTLAVEFADGATGTMPLAFQTRVLSSFKFAVTDVKLDDKKLTVVSEHATSQIDVEVYGDEGAVISTSSQAFDNVKAGAPMTVSWTPLADGPVLRIHLIVHDDKTATKSSDLFPYHFDIAHQEVVFDTGKADIRAGEEPKLVAALPDVQKAIKRYSEAVKITGATIKLFVSGFTDTVGPSSSNAALSDRRAQSIAQWFKSKGIKVAIYARGFGESVLKVETPDETAEEKNRRADYTVAEDIATSGWTRVN